MVSPLTYKTLLSRHFSRFPVEVEPAGCFPYREQTSGSGLGRQARNVRACLRKPRSLGQAFWQIFEDGYLQNGVNPCSLHRISDSLRSDLATSVTSENRTKFLFNKSNRGES